MHYKAEGTIDYTALLFVPTKPPFNLFQPDRKSNLQLYVNRVFISDDLPELMPFFLRFVTGVIDTNDLPLNVSREMLQKTPVMQKIKKGIVKRILTELKKRSEDKADYQKFWDSFGIVFKEGLYEPVEERDEIAALCRFHQTKEDALTSFDEYIASMKPEQENIYYLTGTDLQALKNNPQLEGFAARGINVLLLTDPIDEFWVQTYQEHKGKKILSVMHAGSDIEKIKLENEPEEKALEKEVETKLLKRIQEVLKENVKDVNVGYMFQSDNLLEWRTVYKNITLGLEIKGKVTKKDKVKADNFVDEQRELSEEIISENLKKGDIPTLKLVNKKLKLVKE